MADAGKQGVRAGGAMVRL